MNERGLPDRRNGNMSIRYLPPDMKAAAGFFEEIPAFLIMTVGLAIFFISFFNAYSLYAASTSLEKKVADSHTFNEQVREYVGFIYDADGNPLAGRFDYFKILNQTDQNISKTLSPGSYEWVIGIKDISNYTEFKTNKIFKSRDMPNDVQRQTVTSPIRIRVSHNEVHAGTLITTIWGWGE
ncbi:MAG: hypothetical protein QW728_02655 [Thermoplasmata archaeon]